MKGIYPIAKPRQQGFFNVTDGYKLHYWLIGNPKGIPVVFLHGGPGAGFDKEHTRFFDPKKFNVLLFDQRGAGKSTPFASTENNNTPKLVQDIRVLARHFFGNRKFAIFGGSWGSTLALAYALAYPETVSGMVLRGIYLCGEDESQEFFVTDSKKNYPDAYERFIKPVPQKLRNNWRSIVRFYQKKFTSKERDHFTKEWARFEVSMLSLDFSEKYINESLRGDSYKSLSPLEAHFYINSCFMPRDYLIKNAHKLSGIPTRIVHGRFDHVCRPIDAWNLHKEIKGSKLFFVTAAHSASEPAMQEKLREQMDEIGRIIS
ncbi:MAG TPA: prolyl aminopeptidase [Candidatus Norongarragalinales archaeon]|jgi:proline iminopeptidase|nr:prolyl aminopeptidase [Candidatus Norongarragalinales archaeon]